MDKNHDNCTDTVRINESLRTESFTEFFSWNKKENSTRTNEKTKNGQPLHFETH